MKLPDNALQYAKWIGVILVIVFAIIVFVNGARWVKDFFGYGDDKSDDEPEDVNVNWADLLAAANPQSSIPDPTNMPVVSSDFHGDAILKDLRKVNTTSYYVDASPRCAAYKRAYELNQTELSAIAIAYKEAYHSRLKSDIEDTNKDGCPWLAENNYKKLLLEKLSQLNV